jgi:FixJ family two-component response regulator
MSKTTNLRGHTVFVVDDDAAVLEAVQITLERVGANPRCFSDGAGCLKALHSTSCDLILADVKMPGMNGLKLLREIECLVPSMPVVLMTGYGDIHVAVEALKAGAADFIEKPLEMNSLLSVLRSAIGRHSGSPRRPAAVLSAIELEVLRLLLAGKSTKEIAKLRHRSVRTIEDERARIMTKLGARNPVELLRKVASVRLPDVLE